MAYANGKGSGGPAHPRRLARTYAIRSRKRETQGKLQPRNYTCGLAKGPGMRTEIVDSTETQIRPFVGSYYNDLSEYMIQNCPIQFDKICKGLRLFLSILEGKIRSLGFDIQFIWLMCHDFCYHCANKSM